MGRRGIRVVRGVRVVRVVRGALEGFWLVGTLEVVGAQENKGLVRASNG